MNKEERDKYIGAVKSALMYSDLNPFVPYLWEFYKDRGGKLDNINLFLKYFLQWPSHTEAVLECIHILNAMHNVSILALTTKNKIIDVY